MFIQIQGKDRRKYPGSKIRAGQNKVCFLYQTKIAVKVKNVYLIKISFLLKQKKCLISRP